MKINMDMNSLLIDAMNEYLRAGLLMNLKKLDEMYDSEFENIRVDPLGRTIVFSKADFMQQFRAIRIEGKSLGPIDDAKFISTNCYGEYGSIIMTRVKGDRRLFYHFVWRKKDEQPLTIIREFTFDEDLSNVINIVKNFR
ncbi:hypothetical protein [Bacillus sp. 03113]|uniref:hypothetical protein n=1 Tax=Bacillus sp. 03113 TaxID=2578211 RepID=UPI0011430C5A|nr:hypothetical protein [Bacillus sp. 03113]